MTNEELVQQVQEGRQEAVAQLWDQSRRFIARCAREYHAAHDPPVDVEDLIQTGFFAMLQAAKKYQQDGGALFLGYLKFWLWNYFQRSVWSRGDAINSARSLDEPIDEDGTELGELIRDPGAEQNLADAEDRIYLDQLRKILDEELDQLRPDYSEVIRWIYLDGKAGTELAQERGITPNAIYQKRKNALRRLKWSARLRAFVEDRTPYKWTSKPHSVEDIVIQREYLAGLYLRRMRGIDLDAEQPANITACAATDDQIGAAADIATQSRQHSQQHIMILKGD